MADTRERHTLREWRNLRKMSPDQLAHAAGVTLSTVYSAERNRHQPRYKTLRKFAQALSRPGEPVTTDQIIWPEPKGE